jgi:hypothetical protein
MSEKAQHRAELRPHGVTPPSCHACVFLPMCGGIQPERPLLDCFDHSCCGDGLCDNVCPFKGDFQARMREVRGLRFDDLAPVGQRTADIPCYVPVIDHKSLRHAPLACPVVALDTYRVFRLNGGAYRAIADDAAELRRAFGLDPLTRIILRGTAQDAALERYWAYRKSHRAPEQMKRLGVSLVIGPNFSHFLDVPRTDNLFNRKRQLICLEEMAQVGLDVVPHLSGIVPGDWAFWRDYLRENGSVTYVAKEFQTGNKNPTQGRRAIDRLARLQDEVGRRLHPLIIGGGQFVEYVAARFAAFTLIDSEPFTRATRRRRFDRSAGKRPWTETWTLRGQPIDRIVAENIAGYAAWIEDRVAAARAAA